MFVCVGIAVPRQAIRDKVKEIYPESVNNRKRKTIVRREYTSNGPHDCWHVDGNHMLRTFTLHNGKIVNKQTAHEWVGADVLDILVVETAIELCGDHFSRMHEVLSIIQC